MAKAKASRIKKTNKQMTKLRRQGKLKLKRHRNKVAKRQNPPKVVEAEDVSEAESDHGQDMLSMVDKEDLDFLKDAVVKGKYTMFKDKSFTQDRRLLQKQMDDEEAKLENEYEKEDEEVPRKKIRMLLPIKTKSGLIKRTVEEEIVEEEEEEEEDGGEEESKTEEQEDDEGFQSNEEKYSVEKLEDTTKPVCVAEMLACREHNINVYKYKIGLLSSGLLEDPHNKVMNIARLLEIFDEWSPELQVTLKKLVTVSLLEIFKDIIPSYQIKHQDDTATKLKKETRELQGFEKSLLKGYRGYLMRLEKMAARLHKKKGDTRPKTKPDVDLGELAVKAFCELLLAHSHFNYSSNIVRLVVPFLDHQNENARSTVCSSFKQIFASDKRGEITLEIVRKINDLVKTRKHAVRPEVVAVLSNLRIKDVNLDQIKEAEMNKKKLEDKKSRVINLSKKEKKRRKRIAEVEKELMETKAEENKQKRQTLLTETTKILFTIYFRILKNAPTSGLLSETLQGLAKFAHCINVEFYHDLVTLLNRLMSDGQLKVREQLNCVLTVFRILSGQGEALNIDPNKFYSHLYANMTNVGIGKMSKNGELLLECLDTVVVGRRKKLTTSRLLAFTKRLATISLCQEHHLALSFITLVSQMLKLNKSIDALLEADSSVGQGVYLPELMDPEYCNATAATIFETALLQKHYHPTVRELADHIVNGAPATGRHSIDPAISKLTAREILKHFDPSEVSFKPAVPVPAHKEISSAKFPVLDPELENLCSAALNAKIPTPKFSLLVDDKKYFKQELDDDDADNIFVPIVETAKKK
ncbi:Nucleolar complex-associated protein [Nesidiocoris tenuis]|uniref:NOC3-like protein n=1 Tax=Nesidiocoris tenuis TaxID=355587 RepID=A0ABN7B4V2_9HEMI|nr:Nucleolar complex-associated protein [Nesidiocoris tenuis]